MVVIRNCHNGKGTCEHVYKWNHSIINGRFIAEEITTEQHGGDCFYFNMRAKSCIRTLLKLMQKVNGTHGTEVFS